MLATTEVAVRPGRGRCLIAAKDLYSGDLILETEPVGAVLDEGQARTRCASCFASIADSQGGGGSRCSGCKNIWYCSRRCQKVDWTDHELECKAWAAQNPDSPARTPTRTLRLAGRIMNAMNKLSGGREKARRVLRENVAALVDHNDQRTPMQQEQYRAMAGFVAHLCVAGSGKETLSWPSTCGAGFPGLVDAAYALMGKLSCNVFSITSDVGADVVGCGLYIKASTVNHSCIPNATQSFNGRTLALRCTRPLVKGEEITIGITELHRPRSARRLALRAGYFFGCQCMRCDFRGRAVEEDARLTAHACPNANCTGMCTNLGMPDGVRTCPSRKNADEAGDEVGLENGRSIKEMFGAGLLSCDKCGACRQREGADREKNAIGQLLQRGKALVQEEGTSDEGRKCLQEVYERATRCLYRSNWMLSDIYTELTSISLEIQDLDAAAKYACEGLATHRACLKSLLPYYPPWVAHLSIAGKLLLCVRHEPQEALRLLHEALMCVRVTHGEQHPLYGEIRDLMLQASTGG